jgi:hypothetical protein
MIELLAYPTGRPCWIDPDAVTAILDTIEAQPAKVVGGQPVMAIVGTTVIVEGASVHLAGHAGDVSRQIFAARGKPRAPLFGLSQ